MTKGYLKIEDSVLFDKLRKVIYHISLVRFNDTKKLCDKNYLKIIGNPVIMEVSFLTSGLYHKRSFKQTKQTYLLSVMYN